DGGGSMSIRGAAWGAATILIWAWVSASGQAVMPISAPDTTGDSGCPSFNSSSPSAASHNCANSERSRDSMDGGKHVLFSLGSVGGYDSAFNARPNLAASFEGGMAYAGLMYLQPNSFSRFENTSSLVNYAVGQGITQYMNSTGVSLVRMRSPG